jgi:hypothetical protein
LGTGRSAGYFCKCRGAGLGGRDFCSVNWNDFWELFGELCYGSPYLSTRIIWSIFFTPESPSISKTLRLVLFVI